METDRLSHRNHVDEEAPQPVIARQDSDPRGRHGRQRQPAPYLRERRLPAHWGPTRRGSDRGRSYRSAAGGMHDGVSVSVGFHPAASLRDEPACRSRSTVASSTRAVRVVRMSVWARRPRSYSRLGLPGGHAVRPPDGQGCVSASGKVGCGQPCPDRPTGREPSVRVQPVRQLGRQARLPRLLGRDHVVGVSGQCDQLSAHGDGHKPFEIGSTDTVVAATPPPRDLPPS